MQCLHKPFSLLFLLGPFAMTKLILHIDSREDEASATKSSLAHVSKMTR